MPANSVEPRAGGEQIAKRKRKPDNRKLEKTATPGVYRKHADSCNRRGRCRCPYVATWKEPGGRSRKRSFARYEEAREFKGGLASGKTSRRAATSDTLATYYERWRARYRGRTSRGIEKSTMREYRTSFRCHLLKLPIASMKLRDIEAPDVGEAYEAMERRGASPSTITRAKAALGVLFATALQNGEILSNPARDVRYVPSDAAKRRHAKHKPKDMTETLLKATLNALSDRWQAFFTLQAQTGVRIGELLGLTWQNVHLGDDPHIVVVEQWYRRERKPTKTDKFAPPDRVPLSAMMASWLSELRPENARPDSPVFPSAVGRPYDYSNVRDRVVKPALIKAGVARLAGTDEEGEPIWSLDYRATHHFRHACATILPKYGKTREQMKAWLRHRNAATTDRYMHLTDDGLGSADVWDEILGDVRGNLGATQPPPAPANGSSATYRKTAQESQSR